MMLYHKKNIIDTRSGNNAFAWDERTGQYGQCPTLTIPSLIDGTLDDVQSGEDIVFEEMENGKLRPCVGLKYFVRLINHDSFITIFDNHNHALYFWIEAVKKGILKPGFTLIHIDEHSDLWHNENNLDLERALHDDQYAWEFTNLSCNVGNYIEPAIRCGLVGDMIRIENEYQIDEYMDHTPHANTLLNIDLDIFAPELDHIDESKKIQLIKNLLKYNTPITIATSPYFIEQGRAIEKLHNIHEYNMV